MASAAPTHPRPAREVPGIGGAIVYWLLLGMALAGFTPCVLLPEWRHLQSLELAERASAERVRVLQERVDREQRVLEAMTSDAGAVARLAQRDLGLRYADEEHVELGSIEPSSMIPADLVSEPPVPPIEVDPVWPDPALDRLFCDPATRPLIMGLSAGLAAVAFLLFGRRPAATPV